MKELSQLETQNLIKRLPSIELSYETIAHKKVFPYYNISIAIPTGKKYYAWFSFHNSSDVCYMMELNRDKKISKVNIVDTYFDPCLSLGTLVYGTLISESMDIQTKEENNEGRKFFIVEDIFHFKGISLKNMTFGEKLGYIEKFMKKTHNMLPYTKCVFVLPVFWGFSSNEEKNENEILDHFENYKKNIPYNVHHIQLRKLMEISPYLNVSLNNILSKINKTSEPLIKQYIPISKFTIDHHKPQYRYPTVFHVTADIQFDVYHLFACGKNKQMIYYSIAYIPNIRSSIFMNSLFRNIRENKNIDYIEESDDEDDFQNIAEDKYVDLNKSLNIECIFSMKFKKWIPIRIMDSSTRIIHICKLVNGYDVQ
jgi:hypothetical protein